MGSSKVVGCISSSSSSSTVFLLRYDRHISRLVYQRNVRGLRSTSIISRRSHSSTTDPTMENDMETGTLPPVAWKRRLDTPGTVLREIMPSLKEIIDNGGLALRLWRFCKREKEQGRKAPIDPFFRNGPPASSCQGVPLGGIGGGSIGRGFKGDFLRWQLFPLTCENAPVLADQFSAFVTRHTKDGLKEFSSVLYPGKPENLSKETGSGISSWNWNLSGQNCTYYGLFPRAWTIYDGEPDPKMKITCRQVSPFIPHNYKESSFPTCAFVYELHNTGDEDATVTLLFTWANSVGGSSSTSGGHINVPFIEDNGVRGVKLHHRDTEHSVTYAIAAKETDDVRISVCPSFLVSGSTVGGEPYITAKDMWTEISEKGYFDEKNWRLPPSKSAAGSVIAAAIAATVVVPARGTKRDITFALAWDSPEVKFVDSKHTYLRRYTKFYGKSEDTALKLAHDAILNYKKWESDIIAWQEPILNNETLPDWYRYTLFNELYFLVAGGTIWIDNDHRISEHPPEKHEPHEVSDALIEKVQTLSNNHLWKFPVQPLGDEGVGRLLYLEGIEYMFWNTYDVHFYASYALLTVFPKLELQFQLDFATATLTHNPEPFPYIAYGDIGIRKVFGAVPHDLGTHDPWLSVNSYNLHDTGKWKDLNCKLVIQVYRDAVVTGDMEFARAVWPAAYTAMAYMEQFDRDGDGMIENDGFPDQTYDIWTVKGVSSYSGGLYVGALQAASQMAQMVGDTDSSKMFRMKYLRARSVYEQLWNGSYFVYDMTSDSIQSDQLAGQWYSLSSALDLVVDHDKAVKALKTVYEFNVMRHNGGNAGAVNGMLPEGLTDLGSLQSREVWTGSTYAVAAAMIQHGLRDEGFQTAKGIFLTGWSDQGQGYAFQTPEAWDSQGRYRALAYMRPLAIWAMQWALDPPKKHREARKLRQEIETNTESNTPSKESLERFNKLAQELKQLREQSIPPTKTYSSLWVYVYDYIRSQLKK